MSVPRGVQQDERPADVVLEEIRARALEGWERLQGADDYSGAVADLDAIYHCIECQRYDIERRIVRESEMAGLLDEVRKLIRDGWGGDVKLVSKSIAADLYADALFRRIDRALARVAGAENREADRV